jgi:peptidoglycan/xylan/chitin deacetylase (PgdA/CDA1 family)
MAGSALHSLGIVHAVRASKRRGCRILVYHRFSEDRSYLIAQCEHIRRHYQPVSMRRVAEGLSTDAPLPDNAVAITVDDGYRDFLVHAQPVFSSYEIPATVFLVTDFLDGKSWLWWDQVEYLFDQTQYIFIEFVGRKFDTQSDPKRAAYQVSEVLKRLPNAERLARLDMLQRQLGVELPERPPAEYEPLTWQEVRKLAAEGVEFGCHTRSHPILSSIASPGELHGEIAGSKQRLDEELGCLTLHFCYPNGTWADFNEQTVAIIRSCGFATAVTAESGFNYAGTDPFRLFRLGISPTFPELRFIELLAGLRKY